MRIGWKPWGDWPGARVCRFRALGVALFDGEDPFAQHRPLDDKRYALDHFQTKLLKLPQTMQTARGKQLAQHNAQFLVEFMAKLSAELAGRMKVSITR